MTNRLAQVQRRAKAPLSASPGLKRRWRARRGHELLPARASDARTAFCTSRRTVPAATPREYSSAMNDRMTTILLVEDDEVDVMNVLRAFKKNNILNPVFVAGNGIEALEMLRNGEVPAERRMILLDLNMPKMNGIEFLRELRADDGLSATPVVVLSTSDDERDRVEAYNLNVAGYILKPLTFVNFVEAMATLNRYWTLVEMP